MRLGALALTAFVLTAPLAPAATATPCLHDAACAVVATVCGVRHTPVCNLP